MKQKSNTSMIYFHLFKFEIESNQHYNYYPYLRFSLFKCNKIVLNFGRHFIPYFRFCRQNQLNIHNFS